MKRDEYAVILPENLGDSEHTGRLSHQERVESAIEVKTQRQTYVTVTKNRLEVMEINPQDELYDNHRLNSMNCIVQVKPKIPFKILIEIYSNSSYFTSKKRNVSHLVPLKDVKIPANIVPSDIIFMNEAEEAIEYHNKMYMPEYSEVLSIM